MTNQEYQRLSDLDHLIAWAGELILRGEAINADTRDMQTYRRHLEEMRSAYIGEVKRRINETVSPPMIFRPDKNGH